MKIAYLDFCLMPLFNGMWFFEMWLNNNIFFFPCFSVFIYKLDSISPRIVNHFT